MSTAVAAKPAQQVNTLDKPITYTALGSKVTVELTINIVRKTLCVPTKSGAMPSDQDVIKFMMLCRARELDPYVGDAYLTGYDTKNGPQFSLITAAQALFKRAEMNPAYDGIESGVIVKTASGIEFRQGDLTLDDEKLLGGWARCFRKDQSHPSYDALKFATFDTGYSRWAADPAGMIVKCAEASVLRKAFPTQLGGLYTREEMEQLSQGRMDARFSERLGPVSTVSNLSDLAARMEEKPIAKELRLEADKIAGSAAGEQQAPAADATPDQTRQQSEAVLRYEALSGECDTQAQIDQLRAAAKKDESLTKEERAEAEVYLSMAEKRIGKK